MVELHVAGSQAPLGRKIPKDGISSTLNCFCPLLWQIPSSGIASPHRKTTPAHLKPGTGPDRPLPPRIEATPEEMARAMFRLPADHQWQYEQESGAEYRCTHCRQEVAYPEALYNNSRCEQCHDNAVN